MIVRTFTAPDLEKALWLMSEDLGPSAVILKTRFSSGNHANSLKFVEITATLDSSLYGRQIVAHPQIQRADLPQTSFHQDDFVKAGHHQDLTTQIEIVEVIGW